MSIMNEEEFIADLNKVLKNNFPYVPLAVTMNVANDLIDKGWTFSKKKEYKVLNIEKVYAEDETCVVCGKYTPEGHVCAECLKKYDLIKIKEIEYNE